MIGLTDKALIDLKPEIQTEKNVLSEEIFYRTAGELWASDLERFVISLPKVIRKYRTLILMRLICFLTHVYCRAQNVLQNITLINIL